MKDKGYFYKVCLCRFISSVTPVSGDQSLSLFQWYQTFLQGTSIARFRQIRRTESFSCISPFQLPCSSKNNPYANVAYFGMAYLAPLGSLAHPAGEAGQELARKADFKAALSSYSCIPVQNNRLRSCEGCPLALSQICYVLVESSPLNPEGPQAWDWRPPGRTTPRKGRFLDSENQASQFNGLKIKSQVNFFKFSKICG